MKRKSPQRKDPLKEIAKKVIDNREIKTLLLNYLKSGKMKSKLATINPSGDRSLSYFESLVLFQERENEVVLEEAGYQLGEPWAGNIMQAPVLFVSRTLAYVADEICPRYVPQSTLDTYETACTDKIFQNGSFINGNMDVCDVITWCNERFTKAALKGNGLYVRTTTGEKAVNYWGALRKNFEFLLPESFKKALRKR